MSVTFRDALAADSPAIAALHAASWRAHYRGSMTDAYLDGEIEAERQGVWSGRLQTPRTGQVIVLAETDGIVQGFSCAFADHDPVWGTLIDNLHVRADRKRGGLGRAIVGQVGRRLKALAPDRPVHLFVLDANHPARAFYDRIGGEQVSRERHVLPDGSDQPVTRYAWTSPRRLIEAAEGKAS